MSGNPRTNGIVAVASCSPRISFNSSVIFSSLAYRLLFPPNSELLNEIEIIKAKNLKDRPKLNGAGRKRFERRWVRLEEIKQELRQLTAKDRVQK
jgi:hypothetical protein